MPSRKAVSSRKPTPVGQTGTPTFRLSPDQRADILRRLKAGEKSADLAREFEVTRQAISLIKIKDASEQTSARMVSSEVEKLHKIALSSAPSKHGLAKKGAWNDRWSYPLLHQLAEKICKRRLMRLPVRRLQQAWFPDGTISPVAAYNPDRADGRARILAEMRDREFLEFLRRRALHPSANPPPKANPAAKAAKGAKPAATPKAAPAKRGRKPAPLEMPPPEAWEMLNPGPVSGGKTIPSKPAKSSSSPLARVGKHRGSKGSPFTAARKKKKKNR